MTYNITFDPVLALTVAALLPDRCGAEHRQRFRLVADDALDEVGVGAESGRWLGLDEARNEGKAGMISSVSR
jgi:hypothetical protein